MNKAILFDRIPGLKRVHLFEEIESTNDFGKKLLTDGPVELPALIYTSKQTRGRGRGGKTWISGQGSLTFSFMVDSSPKLSLAHESLLWGIAVAESLNALATPTEPLFSVKWPNDVMANEKKVAGILIESIVQSKQARVVGIGINLSNSTASYRDSPATPGSTTSAISVEEISGGKLDAVEVLASIWSQWNRLRKLPTNLIQAALTRCDFLRERQIQLESGNLSVSGSYQGIDSRAAIRIKIGSQLKSFQSGSITGFGPRQDQSPTVRSPG